MKNMKINYSNSMEIKKSFIMETFKLYGDDKLDDLSLLSLILRENVIDILKRNSLNTIFKIGMLSNKELEKLGISKNSVLKLNALVSLCKRGAKEDSKIIISSPNSITGLCKDLINSDQEVFRIFCLNTKNAVIYQEDIFKGTLNSSIVHPREIFKTALKCSASSIVAVHNHPSGDTAPSKEDILITERLVECGKIVGISLLDHVIVGKKGQTSLKKNGLI